jgi:hypothetical protein
VGDQELARPRTLDGTLARIAESDLADECVLKGTLLLFTSGLIVLVLEFALPSLAALVNGKQGDHKPGNRVQPSRPG